MASTEHSPHLVQPPNHGGSSNQSDAASPHNHSEQLNRSADLGATWRKNLIKLGMSLLGLGIAAAIVVHVFHSELQAVTDYVFEHFGLGGVAAAIFVTDSVISPLPPDSLLILISASEYHQNWPLVITFLGVISTFAGYTGYGLGRLFSHTSVLDNTFRKVRERSRDRILKYGAWAIVLGALTPVPFSITCWTAGLMHVPFRSVLWPCVLRVPRYLLYYAVIAYMPLLLS